MKTQDRDSIVGTLENLHRRLCRIESTICSKDTAPESIQPPSLFDARPIPVWQGHAPAQTQQPERARYYRDIANDINTKVNEFISKGVDMTHSRDYTEEIKNIIRPHLAIVRGSELQAELRSLFARAEWARGDRDTHAFVGVIWNALRGLDLWN